MCVYSRVCYADVDDVMPLCACVCVCVCVYMCVCACVCVYVCVLRVCAVAVRGLCLRSACVLLYAAFYSP